jgi:hypothetical protein
MAYYWLTPPSRAIFFVSVLLAVLALLVRYAHVAIPVVSHYTFETLLLAFVLLLSGNMFRGEELALSRPPLIFMLCTIAALALLIAIIRA